MFVELLVNKEVLIPSNYMCALFVCNDEAISMLLLIAFRCCDLRKHICRLKNKNLHVYVKLTSFIRFVML